MHLMHQLQNISRSHLVTGHVVVKRYMDDTGLPVEKETFYEVDEFDVPSCIIRFLHELNL